MKRAGFTMIELIFVIVILGILAAVAIPKLSATRTDAEVSKMSSNLSTIITDMGSYWTANGSWGTNWSDMTNVPLNSNATGTAATTLAANATVYLASGTTAATGCFTINAASDGNVTVVAVAVATASDAVCVGSSALAIKNNTAATGTGKVHTFGGTGVTY
ncbi:MAG: general secretion pathway protein G [Sulfurimonas sp.]|jgi:general secretion pathway protein G